MTIVLDEDRAPAPAVGTAVDGLDSCGVRIRGGLGVHVVAAGPADHGEGFAGQAILYSEFRILGNHLGYVILVPVQNLRNILGVGRRTERRIYSAVISLG